MRAGPRFADAIEARYFVYYCEGISSQIGGPFGNKLWDQLIPQAGSEVPFIGRAVIALGALSKAQSERQKENPHHAYALAQYVRALQGMRRSVRGHPSDVRTALIGCLLVFCFESLQGHQGAASAHASSGSNLIASMCLNCQPKSWRESELGAELYSAFSGLNIQSLLFLDKRDRGTHAFYKKGLSEAAKGMPEAFGDLEECRRFWHYIMRRNLHFSLEVRDALSRTSQANSSSTHLGADDSHWMDHTSRTETTSSSSSSLLAERDSYVQDICRWEIASAPLLCRLFSPATRNEEAFLISCLLRIHAAMNIVLLTRAFSPPETAYDKFESQFRTVVQLSERIHRSLVSPSAGSAEGGTFRFEIGILPALSQVGLLCRERRVRGRAIGLLRRCRGYKEGIWDAEGVGAVAGWVRDLEEGVWVEERDINGSENEYWGGMVPEENRVQLVGCEMRVEERWARIAVKQSDGVERQEVVRW
ncbi:uncharacterized protein K444DRAFT_620259 [Hyaloscypha bicolor E]|uniref:Transcription factor domain-containing protein n=1 Tax=Hyaloscypha bicolor E TaxID=1095630 RepID=A0A2J6SJZ6_9HELO|nr:uncharacterized protein K444DRAFT_620259 [Hyaloscypha bicolor E]PMD51098.1 hypothetical protein K444DRAFT_620259 [Hyaloscypha bicolor E]